MRVLVGRITERPFGRTAGLAALFLWTAWGHADLAVAQDRVFVSSSRLLIGVQANRSASVRSGDVDGDDDVDLVVANGRHWPGQNLVFLNQTRARFNVARPLGRDLCTSYACELADLDGDGDLDVAVGNDQAPSRVFLNDGTGQFRFHTNLGQPRSVRSLSIADIDGDQDMDLILTCRGSANPIYLNNGSADFQHALDFGTREDSTIDVAVVDLNEDGRLDLILANRDDQPNTILLAEDPGNSAKDTVRFGAPVAFGTAESSRAVATADFDGDGHMDWVVGNIGAANVVFLGDGTGGVSREIKIGRQDGQTFCIAVADLDRDGRPDIVAGNQGQPNVVCYNRDHAGRFITQLFGPNQSATYGLCVGDFSGDGYPDIAIANSDQQNQIFVNQPARQ
ncbi:FG-GAP repeat domain-containing protein [Crateriforma spongiae]|uniref:FG-GAP repeat domain-containing protein n=1 Tax=Crateriforma spongiae TaxID=2724528 RepID=UPI00197D5B89|nr:VCBS repeat-containing protein [Crateriforma spongiae]